jgi:hypothetical protein
LTGARRFGNRQRIGGPFLSRIRLSPAFSWSLRADNARETFVFGLKEPSESYGLAMQPLRTDKDLLSTGDSQWLLKTAGDRRGQGEDCNRPSRFASYQVHLQFRKRVEALGVPRAPFMGVAFAPHSPKKTPAVADFEQSVID